MISKKYKNKRDERVRKRQYNYLILSELKECSEKLKVIYNKITKKRGEINDFWI